MFNEEKNASRCVDEVIGEITKIKSPIKLIVVNDGSSDETHKILKIKYKKYQSRLLIVSYKKHKGYGRAIQEGIIEAIKQKFDYALFMDSDLTNSPSDIQRFIEILKFNPDCVKASRYIDRGGMNEVPLKRQLISRIANFFGWLVFGIKDCTNGFRMTKLSKINQIKFKENSFAIILEELFYLKKQNAKIIELPIVLTSRKNSKSSFSYKPTTFINYGKYVIKALFV